MRVTNISSRQASFRYAKNSGITLCLDASNLDFGLAGDKWGKEDGESGV